MTPEGGQELKHVLTCGHDLLSFDARNIRMKLVGKQMVILIGCHALWFNLAMLILMVFSAAEFC